MLLLNEKFEGLIGSDLERDGMYLEISESPSDSVEVILEIFYSDATNKFSITLFKENVALESFHTIYIRHQNLLFVHI